MAKKIIIVLALIFVLMPIGLFLKLSHKTTETENLIFASDHAKLLNACRKLMDYSKTNEVSITQNEPFWGESSRWKMLIRKEDASFNLVVSGEIASINPKYILVSPDVMLVCLSLMPKLYLLAFNQNIPQYGSTRISDGLWFSADPEFDRGSRAQGR